MEFEVTRSSCERDIITYEGNSFMARDCSVAVVCPEVL
jgi:hypothetical protein